MKTIRRTPAASLRTRITAAKALAARERFISACHRAGVPEPVAEYGFARPARAWRWDYCWPDARLALEVDGGIWVRGKHGRGSGIVKDHEKRNAGAVQGWRLIVVEPKQLCAPSTLALLRAALVAA